MREPAVVAEARRWTTGHRGPVVGIDDMAGADLSAFVTQALVVGSHAIATAGGIQEAYDLGALVTEVGDRTAEASAQATRATGEAIQRVTATIESSTAAVRTAIGEIGAETRRSFADNVEAAGKALSGELDRLLGGEHPALMARLTPVLDRFGRELEARSVQQTASSSPRRRGSSTRPTPPPRWPSTPGRWRNTSTSSPMPSPATTRTSPAGSKR